MPESEPLPMSRTAAIATDILVGVAAGLAASLAMNLFQAAWAQVASPPSDGPPATEKAADVLSQTVAGKKARPKSRKRLGSVVHYATGAVFGGIFGLTSGIVPAVTAGRGLLFGVATWLAGDELAVPALGLGSSPSRIPLKLHAFGLASHLVFALTLDLVRRQLNELISARQEP